MNFTENQLLRYRRNILLSEIGEEGQAKICRSRVLVVGAGGLGSPVALYLAAAGVGTLGLIDHDMVDVSNLQRQIIHSTEDLGKAKTLSAEEKINQLNPDVQVQTYQKRFSAENAFEIIRDYDFVVDATDNFTGKFLINDACVMAGKAFSHGGIFQFTGQTFTYIPGTACCRCLFHSPPDDAQPSSQVGVLGAVAGITGSVQAAETLKYLTGAGDLLTNRLLTFNALTMEFRTVRTRCAAKCPVCGEEPVIKQLVGE